MDSVVSESPSSRLQNAVRELRLQRGWNPEELAVYAGVAARTVRLIEAGDHNPTADTMLRICAALGEPFAVVFWADDGRAA
jgi:transcriptional regulator with XRE-family HTH domain